MAPTTFMLLAVAMVTVRSENCPEMVDPSEWRAQPPRFVEKIKAPVPYVVIHHTYIPPACNTSTKCEAAMRGMQAFHMSKGWNNIGYNFAIGGDNKIYIGRGWDTVGAHAPKYNYMSVGICFIGDYSDTLPSEDMINAAIQLIQCGVERGSIASNYKLIGHRQVRDTLCPGTALYQAIQSWQHWDSLTDIVPRTPSNDTNANVLDFFTTDTPSTTEQQT